MRKREMDLRHTPFPRGVRGVCVMLRHPTVSFVRYTPGLFRVVVALHHALGQERGFRPLHSRRDVPWHHPITRMHMERPLPPLSRVLSLTTTSTRHQTSQAKTEIEEEVSDEFKTCLELFELSANVSEWEGNMLSDEQIAEFLDHYRRHLDDAEWTEMTLLFLANIAECDETLGGTKDVPQLAIDAYRRFPQCRDVAVAALQLMGALSADEIAAEEVGQLGGVEIAFDTMSLYFGDTEAVESAIFAIGQLSSNLNNAKKIHHLGVLQDVERAMQVYEGEEVLQAYAISTLANLVNGHAFSPTEFMTQTLLEGVITAHRRFWNNEVLMERFLALVTGLAMQASAEEVQTDAMDDALESLIGRVLESLQLVQEAEHIPVLIKACMDALAALQGYGANRGCDAILEQGGVNMILSTLRSFNHFPTIVQATCSVLWVLTDFAEHGLEHIQHSRGLEILLNAMVQHKTDAEVLESVVPCLANLSVSPSTHEMLIPHVHLFVSVVRETDLPILGDAACFILHNLVAKSSDAMLHTVLESGAVECFLERLQQSTEPSCVMVTLCALDGAIHQAGAKERARNAGAERILERIALEHRTEERVYRHCLRLMKNLLDFSEEDLIQRFGQPNT